MEQEQTIGQALATAPRLLTATSTTPRLDAELLLGHTLGWNRAQLLAAGRQVLTREQQAVFAALVARRQDLEPIAYITGHREFYGLDFEVTPATLVPRPETELLVDLALQWLNTSPTVHRPPSTSPTLALALAVSQSQLPRTAHRRMCWQSICRLLRST